MAPDALKLWRRAERARLLALRTALPPALRRDHGEAIATRLRELLAGRPSPLRLQTARGSQCGLRLGVYWPFRAEFDPRPLVDWLMAEGSAVALPVVIDKKGPLEYRAWRPGEPLVDGVWGIPVPEKREIVVPDAVLAPLVGFDEACYRLGYGGGYFDRTLAALEPKPLAIGVGFELSRIETIHPQPFDVPMDFVVTEAALRRR